ncbi:MAG: alpha/beta hydrolase [Planctomycetes bacterium]|nr:alpha/beta hydrolase [Planctomycetota bacterium]
MATSHPISWLAGLWPRVIAHSGVGYLAVAYGVSRWLTRRSPAVVSAPVGLGEVKLENPICVTTDGVRLQGWIIEPPTPRGTIALFHGLRGNRMSLLDRITILIEGGYRCVAFDHRAHGESGGGVTSFGYHERHDVAAVAQLVTSRWPDEPRAALGFSMGAAALCFAGPNTHAFDAIILESVYHDLARAFHHRIGGVFPEWFQHFRRGVIWFTQRRLGVPIHEIAPIDHIARLVPRPTLLLTGSDDPHAPPHEVRTLAEQMPESARFHIIAGADHENVVAQGGDGYRQLLLAFLDRHLANSRHVVAA